MKVFSKSMLGKTAIVAMVWYGSACSKDQEQTEEPVQAEEASQDSVQAEIPADTTNDMMPTEDDTMGSDSMTETAANPESTPDANRVVRYAKSDAKIYSDASETTEVGTLHKGETLVVLEEGDWYKISANMFVKKSDLSNTAVARARPAQIWTKPAH